MSNPIPLGPPSRASLPAAILLLAVAATFARAQIAAASPDPRMGASVFAAPDSVLDLATLERTVLARNPSYAAMGAAAREANAAADRERSLDDPMLELGVAPRSIGASGIDTGWRASITQSLPLFGQRGLRGRMASASADAARGDLDTARLDLILATRSAFYDDYHEEQVRASALETLEWMRRSRSAALARYSAGTAPQQDVLAADVEIAMLDHQAVMAERNRLLVEARLRQLLHFDPLAPLPSPPDTLPLPDRDETRLLIMRSNERTRPEIRRAEAEVESQRARLALARRERLPETRFGAGYDRTMTEPEYRPSVTLSISAPLSLGRHAAEERVAQAGLDGARSRLDAARDALLRRVTEASTEFEESLHELEVLRDGLLPAAERSQIAARAGYEAGRGDFNTVIRAVRDELSARLEYHRTLAAVNQARAELERALGGPAASPEKESR
jgi:outer membrane protein TolC